MDSETRRRAIVWGQQIADQEIAQHKEIIEKGGDAGLDGFLQLVGECASGIREPEKLLRQLNAKTLPPVASLACIGAYYVLRSVLESMDEKEGKANG